MAKRIEYRRVPARARRVGADPDLGPRSDAPRWEWAALAAFVFLLSAAIFALQRGHGGETRVEAASRVGANVPVVSIRTLPADTPGSRKPLSKERPARRSVSRARSRLLARQRPRQPAPRAVAAAPRNRNESAVTLNARAYRLQKQGRHQEAEALLRRAVERDPGYAYAQYNYGWSLLEQGKPREALGPLRTTAAQQPDRWEPQQRLAEAYEQLGQWERAAEAYARARALRGETRR